MSTKSCDLLSCVMSCVLSTIASYTGWILTKLGSIDPYSLFKWFLSIAYLDQMS